MSLKSTLFSFCFLASVAAYAQPKAGDMIIGGNVGFNYLSQPNVTSGSFTFAPSAGYFIDEHLVVGTNLSIGSSNTVTMGFVETETSTQTLGIGSNATYYLMDGPLQPFAGVMAAYNRTESVFRLGNIIDDPVINDGLNLGVRAGAAYWFAQNIAATASVNYNLILVGNNETNNQISGGLGLLFIWSR